MPRIIYRETVTTYRVRPRYVVVKQSPDPGDNSTGWGLFVIGSVLCGAVQGGWGGAAIGFLIVVFVYGAFCHEH